MRGNIDMYGGLRVASKWLLLFLATTCASSLIIHIGSGNVDSTIVVPERYPTIQSAIDAANVGDTILVMPGKYVECLTINKSLRLIGSGSNLTIIESTGEGHTIEIAIGVSNVSLRGFTIKGKDAEEPKYSGIYVRGHYNDIEDNLITDHLYGIHMYDSSGNVLRNNNMTDNRYNLRVWGLYLSHFLHDIDFSNLVNGKPVYYLINKQNITVPSNAGYVALVNSSKIIVKDSNLSNNAFGVLLPYTNNSLIINTTSTNNERGLYMICAHNNTIVNNNFSSNGWSGVSTISSSNNIIVGNIIDYNKQNGIRLSHAGYLLSSYSNNNVVVGNTIRNNYDGLYLEKANDNKIAGNVVMNNMQYGIMLDESPGNVLYKNVVKDNKYCIRLYGSSRNIVYHNNFLNNDVTVYPYSPSVNAFDNGSEGNYWSDYAGEDADGDGIGDTFYLIDENNQDRYPLIIPLNQNIPPTAKFDYHPIDAKILETISFVDESTDTDGRIVLWIWNFDGDYCLQCTQVSKKFEKEGNHTATLTIFDDEGATGIATRNVFVRLFFSFLSLSSPKYGTVGKTIEVSATLQSEDMTPLQGFTINFYVTMEGSNELIVSAITNSSGVATSLFTPDKTGNFWIRAVFEGNEIYDAAGDIEELIIEESHPYILWFLIIGMVLIGIGIVIIRWRRLKKVEKP